MSSTAEDLLERQDDLDEAAIRTAFEAAVREDGRPLSQIATETGIPYGTLSSWRGGTYAGRTARIARAAQAWMTGREARARARTTQAPEPGFVMTKTASSIWERCEFAQTAPAIALIVGDSGLGKTRALKAYGERYPSTSWVVTMDPCHHSIGAALRNIAQTLNVGAPHSSAAVSAAIKRRLAGTRGLLMIDEANHLSAEALDQVRSIYDGAEVGIVLAGSRQLAINMGMDRRQVQLAQISSRVGVRFTRDRPTKSDIGAVLDAWNVEGEQERAELTGIALLPGGLRSLTMTLRIAFGVAHAADLPLGVQHIRTAWAQLSGAGA